jgi:hypothetical protein
VNVSLRPNLVNQHVSVGGSFFYAFQPLRSDDL